MVYVVQMQPNRDLRPAEKFGKLVYLLPSGSQITFSAGAVTQELRRRLSDFCDNDYLVLIGDPVAIGIAVAVASSWNQGKAKLLKWDREIGDYFPVQINLYEERIKE